MRGTSQMSLRVVEHQFDGVLRDAGAQAQTIGEQLFVLVDALDGSGSLRRALTDPSAEADAKAALVVRLLGAADQRVQDVASALVRSRWSADGDLAEAAEQLGFEAVLASTEPSGDLARVEDELFRITKAMSGQRELRRALVDPRATSSARAALVDDLLAGRATAATALLARRAAQAPRGRAFVVTLVHIGGLAAERRDRLVASVTSAVDLSSAQRERLGVILRESYGRPLQVNVTVDSDVIGGLRIQVGPDVVDSTVLARLAEARRTLAS